MSNIIQKDLVFNFSVVFLKLP